MHTHDIRRIAILLTITIIFGWAIGHLAVSLVVMLSLYCVWLHRNLDLLLNWLRKRKQNDPPEPRGVFEDLCLEIDYLRERHKKRKKRLGSYLKQFQQATRALPDGTVVLDDQGAVQWANGAAEHYLGIRWPEDVNQRVTNLIRTPQLVQFIDHGIDSDSIDIPSPVDANVQLNVRVTPYGNNQRLFVARDVTQLHRANKVRSDFVANVSHELRTPLTVLRGYLENMQAHPDQCPPAWQPALEQMDDHVTRMHSLVETLLLLSRLERNEHIEDPSPVPVAELLVKIHQQSKTLEEHDDHLFALELDTKLSVLGSAKELYSAFSNLIFNAVAYTDARGVIEIRWYRDDLGAHLAVTDNGIGVDAEHVSRLTERFYRVDSSRARSRGGTGLGLAIVKHVMTRHGGSLSVESELGKGSTFRCDFPAESIVILPEDDSAQHAAMDESA